MDLMTEKERQTQQKIIEAHSHRKEVVHFENLINKTYELLKKGQLIDERDIGITRRQFKSVIFSLKDRRQADVLTVYRGTKTIGWILADEVL